MWVHTIGRFLQLAIARRPDLLRGFRIIDIQKITNSAGPYVAVSLQRPAEAVVLRIEADGAAGGKASQGMQLRVISEPSTPIDSEIKRELVRRLALLANRANISKTTC